MAAMIPRNPGYYDALSAWLSSDAALDSLPFRWQVILREALSREDRELEWLSDRLDYLQSEVNARRTEIRRFLMDGQPAPSALTTGQLREVAANRARAAASGNPPISPNGTRHQPRMLNEVVKELLRAGNGDPPGLTEVNRALRAAGQPRATQAELLRAVERLARHGRSRDTWNGARRWSDARREERRR
jgi:hypothetical protein